MKDSNCNNRIGEENINYQGIRMKIIKYRGCNDIDIQFLDGYNSIKKTKYCHFLSGKVKCKEATKTYIKKQKIKDATNERLFFLNSGIKNGTIREIPSRNGYFADIDGNIYNSLGKKLKPQRRGEYLSYELPYDGKNHGIISAHRAVCSAFLSNSNNLLEVNHKDGNKHNNSISNLEWVTRSENQKHRFTCLGHNHIGENNTKSKLNDNIVLDILKRYKNGEHYKDIAKLYGVSNITIYNVIKGKSWVHISYNPNDIKRQVLKL